MAGRDRAQSKWSILHWDRQRLLSCICSGKAGGPGRVTSLSGDWGLHLQNEDSFNSPNSPGAGSTKLKCVIEIYKRMQGADEVNASTFQTSSAGPALTPALIAL